MRKLECRDTAEWDEDHPGQHRLRFSPSPYWRIRESGDSAFFETSPDSSSWTTQASIGDSSLFDLSAVSAEFYAETYGTGSPNPGDSRNELQLWVECGTLAANKVINGIQTQVGSVPYSGTSDLWWRIREAAGTTYREASPDNVSWTVIGSAPTSGLFPLNDLSIVFFAESDGAGSPSPGTARPAPWRLIADSPRRAQHRRQRSAASAGRCHGPSRSCARCRRCHRREIEVAARHGTGDTDLGPAVRRGGAACPQGSRA